MVSNLNPDTIPIIFIKELHVTKSDGIQKVIKNEDIRKEFPHIKDNTHNILSGDKYQSIEIRIDRDAISDFINRLDKEIEEIMNHS